MRTRVLTASAVGFLLQGALLFRVALVEVAPSALRVAGMVGREVGIGLFLTRTAAAATPASLVGARDAAKFNNVGEQVDALNAALGSVVDAVPPSVATSQAEPASTAEGPKACPTGMLLVEGDYCPDVQQECKHWLEDKGRYAYYRCQQYSHSTCLSKAREHKRFCIDRDEYVPPGEQLPASHVSWTDAQRTCSEEGKRVCLESEWNFACEGEEMRPYPYGFKREAQACNADRVDIYEPNGKLRDLRMGANDKPACVSPFGVHNLSGNLEEWTTIDSSAHSPAPRPAMKGAYWQPSRNHCRANQTAHDRFYKGTETGFRCCSDP